MDEKERFRDSARIHGEGAYRRILQTVRAELNSLLGKRQAIDRRTKDLQRMVGTLLATCEEDGVILPRDLLLPFNEEMPLSISLLDAAGAVLRARGDFMTVAEVRDSLPGMETDLHKLWNPTDVDMGFLSQVHSTPLGASSARRR